MILLLKEEVNDNVGCYEAESRHLCKLVNDNLAGKNKKLVTRKIKTVGR